MKGLSGLDSVLNDFDGYMIRDDSSNPSLFYLTGFEAPDPVVYLRTEGESVLLVSPLEFSRARSEADVDKVVSTAKYKSGDSREDKEAQKSILKSFLKDYGVDEVAVPEDFPVKFADDLRQDFDLEPVKDKVMQARKMKDEDELDKLRESQEVTEAAMAYAREIIETAVVEDGVLVYEGDVLTSERLKSLIKMFLIEEGCDVPEETIAASGVESSDPHSTGSGPIKPGEPIIIDIFPKKNRFFGDMTRTFVKGEPSQEFLDMYEAVLEAQEAALDELRKGEGVKACEVHDAACSVLEDHGYKTLRSSEEAEEGFIHSTGHGVGLELHEPPRVADNDEELKEGMVVTIEPGLYIKDVGGVRIEDMIHIKSDGIENFNSMCKEL
jgi:Xaa-Pro aminopeptidase